MMRASRRAAIGMFVIPANTGIHLLLFSPRPFCHSRGGASPLTYLVILVAARRR